MVQERTCYDDFLTINDNILATGDWAILDRALRGVFTFGPVLICLQCTWVQLFGLGQSFMNTDGNGRLECHLDERAHCRMQ
jgi:hypothetical protein